ncbi:hypothetical protein [Polaribacter cellanae]|uniref:Restriction endonuclease n=1 Tax=Polaribacter cellanae TaxID=2818493 RepID=A0A975H6B3_9FLAO|nr:hypothetical protein [Polaribacter cellanae]QTE22291.1 hypothetical protein J3359_16015 [Polaribacter cellanae]
MNKLIPLNYRKNEERLTQKRVEMVMEYVLYCYQKMIAEGKTYKKEVFFNENKTRYNLEEGLSEKLVNDYLGIFDNLEYYKTSISDKPGVELYFNNEAKQSYTENNITKDDYIDIKVQETELSKIWSGVGNVQQIHLAIECKIVEKGYSEYVSDIKKMSDRSFNTPRLNFEGQIAYITNENYSPSSVASGINKSLSNNLEIVTIQDLKPKKINPKIDFSYLSIHKRNHNKKQFSIYHLMLNYNNIILN